MDARKTRLESEDAWQMLASAQKIATAKGRKIREWNPKKDAKDEILADAIGRSGNLRAPTLKVGDTIVIGFNPELFDAIFGSHQ